MLRAKIVERSSYRVDEGTCGFHDYVTHKEPFSDFVNRVLENANKQDTANVQFAGEDRAVILWEE